MYFTNTCLNGLWGAIRSTAAARGGFDRDIISLSTLKATENTAGIAGMAGNSTNIALQWHSNDTIVERQRKSSPGDSKAIGVT